MISLEWLAQKATTLADQVETVAATDSSGSLDVQQARERAYKHQCDALRACALMSSQLVHRL